jgi:membrane fusion protein (multidrug efflux system)
VGQKAQVKVEGEAALLAAGVSRVAPALEESNRSLIIEADLPNPKLRLHAGLFAEIDIVVDPEAKTLAVPAAAVTEFAGVEKVWLVRDGKAETRIVQTGRRSAELVEILQGVAPGDVVAADAQKARRGSRQ